MADNIDVNTVFSEFENNINRRSLLPWWIKIFCWFFMLFGALATICLFLGFTNIKPALALYGFETNEPFSLIGILVIGLGIFKGITAYALWFEKDNAITLGKICAILGIVICGISMLILPFLLEITTIQIRLELVLLIPFLITLNRIEKKWEAINS